MAIGCIFCGIKIEKNNYSH